MLFFIFIQNLMIDTRLDYEIKQILVPSEFDTFAVCTFGSG